ncbi:hypothetical protein FDECE_10152 [Fusarium decemcellulare]|nr:hypothetical protein FDECE_10152 [Fusarium decemcellulare]
MMARSRGGCLNCKRRKRKCDEARPGCQACLKRGIQCEGYATPLRWANGIASRGRFAGASIPDSQVVVMAGTGSSSQDDHDHDSVGHRSTSSPSYSTPGHAASSTGTGPSDLSPPTSIHETQHQIYERFLHSGLHRLYTTEEHCWVQPFFAEMATQSPALVVIAVAIQGYLDDGGRGLSVTSMERVDLALQTFRQELSDRHESMQTSTVCAGLLVCSLCLLQAQPWTMYIELMTDVYDLRNKLATPGQIPIEDMYRRHVLEVMGVMDIPSLVVGRMSQPIGIWKLLRRLQDHRKDGRVPGVEVVSGMPRSLLDILASSFDNDADYTESKLWTWPGEIGEYLQCHLWDCWRLSGILEVRRRQRIERKRRGAQDHNEDKTTTAPSTDIILCRLVASIDALHRAFELPQNQHLLVHNGLMYPLVNASLEVPLLKTQPGWKKTLDGVRVTFRQRDTFNLVGVIFEILDEAWEEGTSTFDMEEAAHRRGHEIAIF